MTTNSDGVPIAWPDVVWPKIYTHTDGRIFTTGICTWFGGDSDPEDDGQTASGLVTKGHPDMMGCALPIPTCKATMGSPLPVMKYLKTTAVVGIPGTTSTVVVPLIDVGPAMDTGHAVDLTVAAFKQLGGNIKTGILHVALCITPVLSPKTKLRIRKPKAKKRGR